MVMEIKVTAQVFDLAGAAQAVDTETRPTTPTRVTVVPVAQEAQQVEAYSYNNFTPVAEVATPGDITPPSGSLLARFDVDGDGSWSDKEYLASQLMLKMKNDCFDGDLAAMSTWLSEHRFSSPMSLDDASAALEMYLNESTS